MITIYHNPRCRKSRETLQLLNDNGVEPKIVLYLEDTPSQKQLIEVIKKLDIRPYDLLRRSEAVFKEKYKGKELSDKEWIKAMIENPKLIERPIVIKEKEAVIGRPPENVLSLLR